MGTRRSKGTGSIYRRCEKRLGCPPPEIQPDGSKARPAHDCKGAWCATIELPSSGTNDRRRKTIVRAKRPDVVRELRATLKALEKAGNLATSSPTVAQWCDQWLVRYGDRMKVGPARKGHQSRVEQYIKPSIGRVRLDKLGVEHVERMHEYVIKDKGLAKTTALGAHRCLSYMLTDAVHAGLVPRNVAMIAKKPRPAKQEKKEGSEYLSSAQAREFLTHSASEEDTRPVELAMWALAFLTGARPGERLGVTRDSLDFEANSITISWQLQRIPFEHGCGDKVGDAWPCGRRKGGYCPQKTVDVPDDQEAVQVKGGLWLTRPKSDTSWREIPMFGPLRDVLKKYVDEHPPGLSGLIFTRDGGLPIDPSMDTDWWNDSLQRAGLPAVKPHSARHTCNTILTELGVPVDVRIKILGHAAAGVNEQVYTHTSDVRVQQAMTDLANAIDWRNPAA